MRLVRLQVAVQPVTLATACTATPRKCLLYLRSARCCWGSGCSEKLPEGVQRRVAHEASIELKDTAGHSSNVAPAVSEESGENTPRVGRSRFDTLCAAQSQPCATRARQSHSYSRPGSAAARLVALQHISPSTLPRVVHLVAASRSRRRRSCCDARSGAGDTGTVRELGDTSALHYCCTDVSYRCEPLSRGQPRASGLPWCLVLKRRALQSESESPLSTPSTPGRHTRHSVRVLTCLVPLQAIPVARTSSFAAHFAALCQAASR